MNIACIVLAAGRSERFGGCKLTAPLLGVPVLRRVLDALPREAFSAVLAVVRAPETQAMCEAAGVRAVRYEGGPLSESIRRGLTAAGDADGALFVNGDMPLLRRETLLSLTEAFRADPEAVIRAAEGGVPASPALFPKSAFPALLALTGERGGAAILREGARRVVTVPALPGELTDADTPEALAAAERLLLSPRFRS